MSDFDAPVLVRREGRIGRITLNRPRALNALTREMLGTIDVALETWRDDPAVHVVVLDASSERAFCAGGDVRTVREWVLAARFDEIDAFFVMEYALNRKIARYPKPYLSLIDGICMGGGIGLAVHGPMRVATENATFAMPEVHLGLFPDVGGSYLLPRLRGRFGFYLGLTGLRVNAADACWLGLATHFVPRANISKLLDGLMENGLGALSQCAEPPPVCDMSAFEDDVNRVFSGDSVDTIERGLADSDAAWARDALGALRAASPSALRWTLELLRRGTDRTLEECQRAEVLLTRRACRHPDFAEGVRATVVDKDRTPTWRPLDVA